MSKTSVAKVPFHTLVAFGGKALVGWGKALVVRLWWGGFDGEAVVGMLWWDGKALMESLWWRGFGGMERLCGKAFGGHGKALVGRLRWEGFGGKL